MNTTPQSLLGELQSRVSELLRNTPAADIERNMKAMLAQTFQRVELVTRDEFDAQLERLSRLQERVAQLEKRLAETTGAGTPEQASQSSRASQAPPQADTSAD